MYFSKSFTPEQCWREYCSRHKVEPNHRDVAVGLIREAIGPEENKHYKLHRKIHKLRAHLKRYQRLLSSLKKLRKAQGMQTRLGHAIKEFTNALKEFERDHQT